VSFRFLRIQSKPSTAIEALLTNNVIGTPGLSMLYQHLGVKEKLYAIPKPHIVSVERNQQFIGVCIFCEREIKSITGFYVRYFAFQDAFRLKALPQQRDQNKASVIRAEIVELLNGKALVTDLNQAFFHYAYVDPRNPRSARLCDEFGFVPVRKYTTRLFSRLWPKASTQLVIKELPATDERIRTLLHSFYNDYNHVSFGNLNQTYYYIENEVGEILAGVQVHADAWRVLTLPGRAGKLLLNMFNYTPLLSRLLSNHFRFLAVEGIYYREGKEYLFEQLLESLLHRFGLHTAIMVVDTDSSVHRLTQQIRLGLLSKLSPEVYGHVIVRGNNTDPDFWVHQQSQPAYISVHDVS
jgi:hypothetical protein